MSDAEADILVVHTLRPLLAPENLRDFQVFMSDLDNRGLRSVFWSLWSQVCEVSHLPISDIPLLELPLGDVNIPLRRFVCTKEDCARCRDGRGGFQFPFLGPWSRRRVVPPAETSPFEARRLLAASSEIMSAAERREFSSGLQLADLVPRDAFTAIYAAELNSLHRREGARIHDILAAARSWQQGDLVWRDPCVSMPTAAAAFMVPQLRAQRALCSWIRFVRTSEPSSILPRSCIYCGDLLEQGARPGPCHPCNVRIARATTWSSDSDSA